MFLQILPSVTQDIAEDSWVLGRGARDAAATARDTAKLRRDVMGLYLDDYTRRWDAMLADIGLFDGSFFLYCEDTDLGLRARWAGWKCLYVADAVVEHHYSHSAGRASKIKAYYVERNRLFVVAKNFPLGMLLAAPWVSLARYLWHVWYILRGRGSAARFRAEGNAGLRMIWYVVRAHAVLLASIGRLWKQRHEIQGRARITPAVFRRLIASHSISARKVAEL